MTGERMTSVSKYFGPGHFGVPLSVAFLSNGQIEGSTDRDENATRGRRPRCFA
jgi:hypothetical protein